MPVSMSGKIIMNFYKALMVSSLSADRMGPNWLKTDE
jgi:hypothetical protein